jgi:hypothetical protein
MSLDQIGLFVRSSRAVTGGELASLTYVVHAGVNADADGLQSFVRTLEAS